MLQARTKDRAAALLPPLILAGSAMAQEATFADPEPLKADGEVIDVGADIGHAGPQFRDLDGDGKTDLLVSSFRGTIEFFRNVGTNVAPEYKSQGKVQAVGESPGDLKFHNW